MRRNSLTLLGLALAALAPSAHAVPIVAASLDASLDASDLVCGDGSSLPAGVICASGGNTTTLLYNQAFTGSPFGSFQSFALTAVNASDGLVHELDQNSIEASGGAGDLYLFSTEQFDFGAGSESRLYTSIGGTTDGSIGYDVYVGTSAFDLGTLLSSQSFGSGGADAPFSGADSSNTYLAGSLWLTQVVHVSHAGTGMQNSSSNAIARVPEPGSLGLLGAGLVAAGFVRRRRRA